MRIILRPLLLGFLAVPSLVLAAPASAEQDNGFADAPVNVSPSCAGTAMAEASVTPLPTSVRGVGVVLKFAAQQQDPSCSLTATVNWRNVDTGATGSDELTVSSVPDSRGGPKAGDHGYGRVLADTGPGAVLVTISTNPGEVQVVV